MKTKHLMGTVAALALLAPPAAQAQEEPATMPRSAPPAGRILPRPRIESLRPEAVTLARKGQKLSVRLEAAAGPAGREGVKLLDRRLRGLGAGGASPVGAAAAQNPPPVTVSLCTPAELAEQLRVHAAEKLAPPRLRQAYSLKITRADAGGRVRIAAAADRGLYYGLVSLCQLLDADPAGNVSLPVGEVLDWPEIACRLAKTSGSMNPVRKVARFAQWLAPLKISQVGIQYHGSNSRKPDRNFIENVRTICGHYRKTGTLETIVYFCPFRGGGRAYQFRSDADKAAYAKFLLSVMAQGAHGIEVDYNDWPGSKGVPIAEVLNLACRAVLAKHGDAHVLYCPPLSGKECYRGMATEQMGRTLAKVPPRVHTLWTGMQTLIGRRLKAEQVERWTKIAGRRPFLWVNRVALGVGSSFSRPVPAAGGARAFCGERLPRQLHRLFEGVHLNAGISRGYNKLTGEFTPEAMAYLATAADFLWNPHDWDAAESARRARRLVEILTPLLPKAQSADAPE